MFDHFPSFMTFRRSTPQRTLTALDQERARIIKLLIADECKSWTLRGQFIDLTQQIDAIENHLDNATLNPHGRPQ